MKKVLLLLIVNCACIPFSLLAQVEKIIVETYYVSDTNDATDTTGGILESGSKTYRVFIDLKPGTKLRRVYGDSNHPIKFISTKPFFNNKADGQSFAKDFSKNRLGENTVALDTWLTLGQTTRSGAKTYFGVLKRDDNDGSFIGGANNDGGSAGIPGGLLINNNVDAGIPLTVADGYDTMTVIPSSWIDYGIQDFSTGNDSTIFGSLKIDSQFVSYNAGIQNSGVMGVNPDSNIILIAQLTTKGEISLEINVEVEEPDGAGTRIIRYVANNDTLLSGEVLSPFLKFPPVCGCTDPDYLEFNEGYSCSNSDSCRTLIVFGCMDSMACNFNPDANYNLQTLCCYPGYCNDRDIGIVCPQLGVGKQRMINVDLFPNPATSLLTFTVAGSEGRRINIEIYNSLGQLKTRKDFGAVTGIINYDVDIQHLAKGMYIFRVITDEISENKYFIKN